METTLIHSNSWLRFDRLLSTNFYLVKQIIAKLMLDLSSFSDKTTSNPVNESMHVEPITSERTDDINALNIATKNAVSYMAGYLLRRITFCPRCQSKMTVASLPENGTYPALLNAKAYRPTGTLIYPSQALASLIGQLETVFVINFPVIVHMEKVLIRLVLYAES